MNTKIKQSVLGGIAGAAAMTVVMMVAPMMGMPKMSPPQMLSSMMNVPIAIGWIIHFMIGIIFAMIYAFIIINFLEKVNSIYLKGIIFGFAAFIFAQIAIGIMGVMMGGMPKMEGSMVMMAIGSIVGHVVFGIVVALFVKEEV